MYNSQMARCTDHVAQMRPMRVFLAMYIDHPCGSHSGHRPMHLSLPRKPRMSSVNFDPAFGRCQIGADDASVNALIVCHFVRTKQLCHKFGGAMHRSFASVLSLLG
jgi:hypothetical protein